MKKKQYKKNTYNKKKKNNYEKPAFCNLESSQASDVRVQNTLRDCLIKFKPDKGKCGIKIPVLAAVRNKNSVTYVKFGEQFCIGDIHGACRLLEDKSFQVNLKSLVS